MSENVFVGLDVLDTQAEACKRFFANEDWDDTETTSTNGLTSFNFHEVSYGELEFLLSLQYSGIAYSATWDTGFDVDAGTQILRFTPEGEYELKRVNNCDINPDLSILKQLLTHHEPLEAIKNYINKHTALSTYLSWERQEEYGKIYRTNQLLLGNPV